MATTDEGVISDTTTRITDPVVDPTASQAAQADATQDSDSTSPGDKTLAEGTALDGGDDDSAEGTDQDTTTEDVDEDVDDATLETIWEAYQDRILKTPKAQKALQQIVNREVSRARSEVEEAQTEEQKVASIISQGRNAATTIFSLADRVSAEFTKAGEELQKAIDGKVFNPQAFDATILDKDKLLQGMKDYGSSIVAATKKSYDDGIQSGFAALFSEKLPEYADEYGEQLNEIAKIANRMTNDPNQAARAPAFFISGLMNFIADRALEEGAKIGEERVKARQGVKDKITSTNAVKAAKAQLEKEKLPPTSPKSSPVHVGSTIKDYNELLQTNPAAAQEMVNEWSRLGIEPPLE